MSSALLRWRGVWEKDQEFSVVRYDELGVSIGYPCEGVKKTIRCSGLQFTGEVQGGDRNVGTISRFMMFKTGWPHWGRGEEVQGHTRMLQHLTVRKRKRSQQTRPTSSCQGGRRKLGDLEPSEESVSKRINWKMLLIRSIDGIPCRL